LRLITFTLLFARCLCGLPRCVCVYPHTLLYVALLLFYVTFVWLRSLPVCYPVVTVVARYGCPVALRYVCFALYPRLRCYVALRCVVVDCALLLFTFCLYVTTFPFTHVALLYVVALLRYVTFTLLLVCYAFDLLLLPVYVTRLPFVVVAFTFIPVYVYFVVI